YLAGDISTQTVKRVQEDGSVADVASNHFWEFFSDPFTHKDLTSLADPGAEGERILKQAEEALALLETAQVKATRNQGNLEQILFGARSYQALGRKLIALGHHRDAAYSREVVAAELESVAVAYE